VSRQVVARAGDIAPGTCKIVSVRGREIGIFNLDGEYFALANRCHTPAAHCAVEGSARSSCRTDQVVTI